MNVRSRHFTAEEILPSCQTQGLCAYLGIGVDGVGVAQIAVAFYLPLCVAAMLLYSAGRARSRAACCTLSVGGRLLGACAMLLIFLLYGPRIMSDREIDRIQLGASETLPRLDAVFGAPGFNFMKKLASRQRRRELGAVWRSANPLGGARRTVPAQGATGQRGRRRKGCVPR